MASSTTTNPATDEQSENSTRLATTVGIVSTAAGSAAGAAGEAAARLPDLADRGVAAFDDANRRIKAGSDEMLTVGTALSFGFAVGLLVGGAGRLLVAIAFVPVAMLGLTLFDRGSQGRAGKAMFAGKPADR